MPELTLLGVWGLSPVLHSLVRNLPASAVGGCGILILLWWIGAVIVRGPRRLCPGPRRSWLGWLGPWAWFLASPCGYDLAGLPEGDRGERLCPECGRRSRRRERVASVRRIRLGVVGACVLAVGAGLWRVDGLRSWRWLALIPSMPLVQVERVLGPGTPDRVRDEVADRLMAGTLSARQSGAAIATLIRDLHDDGVAWNGQRAMYRLAALGVAAAPELERALGLGDWQTRQLAAHVLRGIPWYEPSEALLRVTVEGLADDDLPRQRASAILKRREAYSWVSNAHDGVRYLVEYSERAGPVLAAGMAGTDVQQRLLCAVVAGFAGRADLIPVAGPILIGHLRANHIGGDAKLAAPALFAFGKEIVPWLTPVLDSPDAQQRNLARLILIDLGVLHPPDPGERRRLNTICGSVEDPVLELGPWVEDLG